MQSSLVSPDAAQHGPNDVGRGATQVSGGSGASGGTKSSQPPPPRTGWLVKEGGVALLGKPTWRRRYFVLDGGVLTYYADREAHERGDPPTKGNVIQVRGYRLLESGLDGADIVLEVARPASDGDGGGKPERAWRFRCEARGELKAWVDALVAHGAAR